MPKSIGVMVEARKQELLFDRQTGKLRPLGNEPVLSSRDLGWRGVILEQHRLPCVPGADIIWPNTTICYVLNNAITLESRLCSPPVTRRILPGQLNIFPAQSRVIDACPHPVEAFHVSLDSTFMKMACAQVIGEGEGELTVQYGVDDAYIKGACLALRREVQAGGPLGWAYVESLAASLAVYLVLNYARHRKQAQEGENGKLPPGVVRRALEFMSEHISTEFSIRDVAAAVHMSPYHFSRLFKKSVGLSPYQFVIQQRIEKAKKLMLEEKLTFLEVAIRVGFYDQSHFTHHFKRATGFTPAQYAKRLLFSKDVA